MGGHDHWVAAVEAWDKEFEQDLSAKNAHLDAFKSGNKGRLPGFMVLGMHRSGTSLLSGLLVKGFGYETGGPLIGASVRCTISFSFRMLNVILTQILSLTTRKDSMNE